LDLAGTTDPDELLYWVVDEIARGLAWTWAQNAPAYAAMSPQQARKTLWLPCWHILIHGLRPDWSKRTRETIRTLAQGFPLHPGAGPPHGSDRRTHAASSRER
jgi:hypothetical protein